MEEVRLFALSPSTDHLAPIKSPGSLFQDTSTHLLACNSTDAISQLNSRVSHWYQLSVQSSNSLGNKGNIMSVSSFLMVRHHPVVPIVFGDFGQRLPLGLLVRHLSQPRRGRNTRLFMDRAQQRREILHDVSHGSH